MFFNTLGCLRNLPPYSRLTFDMDKVETASCQLLHIAGHILRAIRTSS
jgi:hypothetical protein